VPIRHYSCRSRARHQNASSVDDEAEELKKILPYAIWCETGEKPQRFFDLQQEKIDIFS